MSQIHLRCSSVPTEQACGLCSQDVALPAGNQLWLEGANAPVCADCGSRPRAQRRSGGSARDTSWFRASASPAFAWVRSTTVVSCVTSGITAPSLAVQPVTCLKRRTTKKRTERFVRHGSCASASRTSLNGRAYERRSAMWRASAALAAILVFALTAIEAGAAAPRPPVWFGGFVILHG